MFLFTPMVRNLLIINLLVFMLQTFISSIDLTKLLGLHSVLSIHFQPFQLLTNIFVHGNFGHLFSNMIGLLVFGSMLEEYIGAKKFLILYLVAGYGACVLYAGVDFWELYSLKTSTEEFMQNPHPEIFGRFVSEFFPNYIYDTELYKFVQETYPSAPQDIQLISFAKRYVAYIYDLIINNSYLIGASGAVFGLMMGAMLLFPDREMLLIFFPFFPIKLKYLIATYAAWEIYSLIQNRSNDNVAHFVHITGMLFGFIIIKYWQRKGIV
ncbi:MAG: rhomboid family intramembrane serine protease [Flammeovirgaceae bacterium]